MPELTKDRIIVALDVDNPATAVTLVENLYPYVGDFKIGLEFINSIIASVISPKDEKEALNNLQKLRELFELLDGKIFWDGKFNDIPRTIIGASQVISSKLNVDMFNIHCLSGSEALRAAKKAAMDSLAEPLVLGVTILTSLDYNNLVELGIEEKLNITDKEELGRIEQDRIERLAVRHLAYLAQECGLDGVIASPKEITAIRKYCQPELLVVTPGIRPEWAAAGDQKRIMTPGEAIKLGADYIVIGRPITSPPPGIGTPQHAVELITEEIEEALTAQ